PPATIDNIVAKRSSLVQSSLIVQTQRGSDCARSDSIWVSNRAGSGSNVAMQTAIVSSSIGGPVQSGCSAGTISSDPSETVTAVPSPSSTATSSVTVPGASAAAIGSVDQKPLR